MITKTPTPSGGTARSIVPTLARQRSGKFDKWYVHAAGPTSVTITSGFSGQYYLFFTTNLKDGTPWNYSGPAFPDYPSAALALSQIAGYQVSGYPGDWLGEGFNHVLRSQLNDKFPASESLLWYYAH